ncbi:MAG: hypothetical protein V3U29_06675 [Phycisphaeraceae bacterium]
MSLHDYHGLCQRWQRGGLGRGMDRMAVARLLLDKAAELRRLRAPAGPIRNPAAVFATWVKLLI